MGFEISDITPPVGRLTTRAQAATKAVASKVPDLGRDALHLGGEIVGEAGDAARNLGNAAKHLPETLPTWKRLVGAARSGERTLLPGQMPAYTQIDPAALRAAQAAGDGQTIRQGFLQGQDGNRHEPVNLVVTGSKDQLIQALRSQGWVENAPSTVKNYARQFLSTITRYDRVTDGPVSNMYLDGKLPVVALSKNSDYNLARDHMRVYAAGTDPVTGQPRWAIAATRDTAATVTLKKPVHDGPRPWDWSLPTPGFGHVTDHDVDNERDLIMADLLASGRVADWAAVPGAREGAKEAKAADGRLTINQYMTDGRVYGVSLKP